MAQGDDIHGAPQRVDHLAFDEKDKDLAFGEKRQADEDDIQILPSVAVDDDVFSQHEGKILADHDDDAIIVSGADASNYLLSMRDDGDAALTFRALFLGTGLSAFQATLNQIYQFKPTQVTIQGTFVVIIAYFLGKAWALVFPRGDKITARYKAKHGEDAPLPFWIKAIAFINPGPWGLKEHAVAAITSTAASQGAASVTIFSAQKLFYDIPLTATNVVLTTISINLFGYGLCGIFRPVTVWHQEAVYWANIPVVKTLQGLHWQDLKGSKPLRYFWYAFGAMFCYEFLPAYVFPYLNSFSIPCLAAMNVKNANTAGILTSLFGGGNANEGLGLFSITFDWQYIGSFSTSLPLKLQVVSAVGYFVCFIVMLAVYYGNAWGGRDLPFMSTKLRSPLTGGTYPVGKLFPGGILSETALAKYGIPRITSTLAYGFFMANAAIGALIAHVGLFWGPNIVQSFKTAYKGEFTDRHHIHMVKHYRECSGWYYAACLVFAFILGLVVVIKENITLPAWGYVVALIVGSIIAPFSTLIYSRFGNGIATNNLSKLIAGLILPGRPVGNMYFAGFSHNVIAQHVNLSQDLKMGEYLKIPPRTMFFTQIWGTIFGGFINYVVMIAIVTKNFDELVDGDGDSAWSGALTQAYNTNAATWALAKYLYKSGTTYNIVPYGLLIGAAVVVAHRLFVIAVPKIRGYSTRDWNFPQFIQYAGYIPALSPQTSPIFSAIMAGFFCQWYLRNYRPRIFSRYMYLVTAAFDGGALLCVFILSFALNGAGGPAVSMPLWFGNQPDRYDHCPDPSAL